MGDVTLDSRTDYLYVLKDCFGWLKGHDLKIQLMCEVLHAGQNN